MTTGMAHSGNVTSAMAVNLALVLKNGTVANETSRIGSLTSVTMETAIMFCRTPTSPTRDINSPVLVRDRKLSGKLRVLEETRPQIADGADRNPAHQIIAEVVANAAARA